MVRIVNKLYPCYPAFSFKKAYCRCQKCTEADCVFLSVIFRLINVADKVSISSSLTLYPPDGVSAGFPGWLNRPMMILSLKPKYFG